MMPNIVTGGDTAGLMRYLVGSGRANEHTMPHLIAGDEMAYDKWAHWEQLSTAQATEIAAHVDRNMHIFNVFPTGTADRYDPERGTTVSVSGVPNHVFHCSLSLSPEEGPLHAETWRKIAQDFMDEMGFTDAGGKAPCRWVAVHHGGAKNGGDHIHIAANIVRADGTKWSAWYSQRRSQRVCNMLERKYGLQVVESREHERGARYDTPAALNSAKAAGQERTDRQVLETRLRAAATAADNEAEFVANARSLGVRIRPRFAKGSTTEVVGYTAALHSTEAQTSRWMAGGKIARDLALSRLRAGWENNDPQAAIPAWHAAWQRKPSERSRAHMSAGEVRVRTNALEIFRRQLAQIDPSDREALAAATHDIAGLLACAAEQEGVGSRERRVIERSARTVGSHSQLHHQSQPVRHRPPSVNTAARMLLHTHRKDDPVREVARSMVTLAYLTTELARLYQTAHQAHTAQAIRRDTAALVVSAQRRHAALDTRTHVASAQPVQSQPPRAPGFPQTTAATATATPVAAPIPTGGDNSGAHDPLAVSRRLIDASGTPKRRPTPTPTPQRKVNKVDPNRTRKEGPRL